MNIDNQKLLVILAILIVLLLSAFLIIAALALYFYIRKDKNKEAIEASKSKAIPLKVLNTATNAIGLCKNHVQNNSVGICSICEEEFCAQCLKEIDKVYLCPEHLKLYVANKWVPITNQKTTPDTPESGVYIYNFKKDIWLKNKTPSYILNEYKINMEGDFVETYVQLHVKEESAQSLKKELVHLKD